MAVKAHGFFIVALVAGVFAAPAPSTAAPGRLAALTDRVEGHSEIVTIQCQGQCPTSLTSTGADNVALAFQAASLAPTFPTTLSGKELVESISTVPSGTGYIVIFRIRAARLVASQSVRDRIVLRFGPSVSQPAPAAAASGSSSITLSPIVRIRLKYADVGEVVGIIAGSNVPSVVRHTDLSSGFNQQPLASTYTGSPINNNDVTPREDVLGVRINEHISYDKRLNAIFLSGSPAEVEALRAQIAEIDVPLPSVILEAQIVELTDTAAKNIGFDFNNPQGAIATASALSRTQTLPDTQLSLQAQIFAAISSGQGRLVAKPRIRALDGTPATILTGDAIPVLTSIALSGSNVIQQQLQYVNVGVSLNIVPRINDDGFVTAYVSSEVSSVTNYIQNIPQVSQRRAVTSATVRDGESFVIGGLLQESDIKSTQKVPLLGDIPILREFFRVRHDSSQKTNLYVIITPHITLAH